MPVATVVAQLLNGGVCSTLSVNSESDALNLGRGILAVL